MNACWSFAVVLDEVGVRDHRRPNGWEAVAARQDQLHRRVELILEDERLVAGEDGKHVDQVVLELDRAEPDRDLGDLRAIDLVEGEHREVLGPRRAGLDADLLALEVLRALDRRALLHREGARAGLALLADGFQRDALADEVRDRRDVAHASGLVLVRADQPDARRIGREVPADVDVLLVVVAELLRDDHRERGVRLHRESEEELERRDGSLRA